MCLRLQECINTLMSNFSPFAGSTNHNGSSSLNALNGGVSDPGISAYDTITMPQNTTDSYKRGRANTAYVSTNGHLLNEILHEDPPGHSHHYGLHGIRMRKHEHLVDHQMNGQSHENIQLMREMTLTNDLGTGIPISAREATGIPLSAREQQVTPVPTESG